MKFVNLTPHVVKLNNGTEFQPSGTVARVSSSYTSFDENDLAEVVFGQIDGLPEPQEDVLYIVSGLVASAAKRNDVVAPATGHPDCVRDETKSRIISVPGFIRAI